MVRIGFPSAYCAKPARTICVILLGETFSARGCRFTAGVSHTINLDGPFVHGIRFDPLSPAALRR